jgi:hypothetical protein
LFPSRKIKIKNLFSKRKRKKRAKREWRRGRLPVRNPPMESRPYISSKNKKKVFEREHYKLPSPKAKCEAIEGNKERERENIRRSSSAVLGV